MQSEIVSLVALDGVSIEAELVRSRAPAPLGTLVIGHPHPLHGGDRRNHVVNALQRAAARAHMSSIAVDFRGVGNSAGVHDDGDAERLDLAAACELADMVEPDRPVLMGGYSFGAVIGLNVTDIRVEGWLAVAPPAGMMARRPLAAADHRPKVVLTGEHDQFSPPAAMRESVGEWINVDLMLMPGVDHFVLVDVDIWCERALVRLLRLCGLDGQDPRNRQG